MAGRSLCSLHEQRQSQRPDAVSLDTLCRRRGVLCILALMKYPPPPSPSHARNRVPCFMMKSKNAPKSAHVYVASSYPQWKQDTLAHLRGCLEANGGESFAPDVMKGLKVMRRAGLCTCGFQAALQHAGNVCVGETFFLLFYGTDASCSKSALTFPGCACCNQEAKHAPFSGRACFCYR